MASERPQVRQRSTSATFSLRSDHSQSSKTSKGKKEQLFETEEEKRRRHLSATGKANPNNAILEAQPAAQALEAPTIASLRDVQHVDSSGNPISEPDLSNPTRPRWERPLDTIRSFEAAIDGAYKDQAPTRPGTAMFSDSGAGYGSRRGSYFGVDHYQPPSRFSREPSHYGSYYGRPRDNYYDNGGYGYDNGYGGPQNGYGGPQNGGRPPRMRYDRRQQSEPILNRYNQNQDVYPSPGYQRSRDTVNTGISNGSQSASEPWANNTDPSSENSSIDRMQATTMKQYDQQPPFQQQSIREEGGPYDARQQQQQYPQQQQQQPPPQQQQQQQPQPSRYHNTGGSGGYYGSQSQQQHQQQPRSQQQQQKQPTPPPHQQYSAKYGRGDSSAQPQPPQRRQSQQQGRRLVKMNSNGGGYGEGPPVPGKDGRLSRPPLSSAPSQKKGSWLSRRFSRQNTS